MFEDRPMADVENMAYVRLVSAGPGLGERHIAAASRGLDEVLAGDFGVGLPADAVIAEEAVDLRIVDSLPAHDIDGRLANDLDIFGGIEIGHAFFLDGDNRLPSSYSTEHHNATSKTNRWEFTGNR